MALELRLHLHGVLGLAVELRWRRGCVHLHASPVQFVHQVLKVRHELVEGDAPVRHGVVRALHLFLHHRAAVLQWDAVEET
jgi:hypothetical protein